MCRFTTWNMMQPKKPHQKLKGKKKIQSKAWLPSRVRACSGLQTYLEEQGVWSNILNCNHKDGFINSSEKGYFVLPLHKDAQRKLSWPCVAGTEMHCSDSFSRQDVPPAVEMWAEGGLQERTPAGSSSAPESSLAWARSLPRLVCSLWLSTRKRHKSGSFCLMCGDRRSPLWCSSFTMTKLQLDFLLSHILPLHFIGFGP